MLPPMDTMNRSGSTAQRAVRRALKTEAAQPLPLQDRPGDRAIPLGTLTESAPAGAVRPRRLSKHWNRPIAEVRHWFDEVQDNSFTDVQ